MFVLDAARVAAALLGAKVLTQLCLEYLNMVEVTRNSGRVPAAFAGSMDEATYSKAIEYTVAKSRFGKQQMAFDSLILGMVLFTGILPASYSWFLGHFGSGTPSQVLYLFSIGFLLAVPSLFWDWIEQFRLEERF